MTDAGTRYTDRQQQALEKRVRKVYSEAQKDLQAKLDDYMRKHKARDVRMRTKLASGEITKEQYDSWMRGQVFMGDQWRAKVKQMTDTLTDANRQSLNILRGGQIDVFGENATYEAYQIEKNFGINFGFGVYDSGAVARLLKDQPELLPRKVVDGRKDAAWNRTKIAGCITQGILQGESIGQIARRMARDTASTDMKAMVRYARTAMTGAQNAGRISMLHSALSMGIRVKKRWMATFDSRTRDAHRNLDGETAEVDQPFQSDLGPILYPGDPYAHPGNVYNCRCTLVYEYLDYPAEYERYDNIEGHPVKEMTYNEWKRAKQHDTSNVVSGVDITKKDYGAFSSEFVDMIPGLADSIKKSKLPSRKEQFEYYSKAVTDTDRELIEFLADLESSVLTYKNESEDTQRHHASIFSVLSTPHPSKLYRGESGEWVKHYGEFVEGKNIRFDHLTFTSPKTNTPFAHTGVIFEFEEGTKSINFPGQDNIDDDELILGSFVVTKVSKINGVPFISLKQKR